MDIVALLADDCIEALIAEGWANNQIALLTTKERHPVHLDFYERGATKDYWREFHAGEAEFYGHVLGFKGLERSVVVLCVNGFKDMDRAAEQLYVGLSRARSLLVVVGDSGLLEEAGGRELKVALSRAQAWNPVLQDDAHVNCQSHRQVCSHWIQNSPMGDEMPELVDAEPNPILTLPPVPVPAQATPASVPASYDYAFLKCQDEGDIMTCSTADVRPFWACPTLPMSPQQCVRSTYGHS